MEKYEPTAEQFDDFDGKALELDDDSIDYENNVWADNGGRYLVVNGWNHWLFPNASEAVNHLIAERKSCGNSRDMKERAAIIALIKAVKKHAGV